MRDVIGDILAVGTVVAYVGLSLAALFCWLTGLIAAFKVTLVAGLVALFIPLIATVNGLLLLFHYNLMQNVALALNMI